MPLVLPITSANIFTHVGENLSSKIPKSQKTIDEYLSKLTRNSTSLYLTPTSPTELNKFIDKLPRKNSSGYDNISNILLKDLKPSLLELLSIILTNQLHREHFLTE